METMEMETDVDLLARIARGDRQGFEIFYRRHAPRLFAFARRICRDRQAAEDLVQEAFIAVWRKAGSYRPERGAVEAWLFALVRHQGIDVWRRERAPGPPVELAAGHAVDRAHERRDLPILTRQALSRLAGDQRRAIEAAYYGDLTYSEAAGRLGLPVGTLKSRIRTGLQHMRAQLSAAV